MVWQFLSAVETLTDEFRDTDHDWERSTKVKKSVMEFIGPYFDIIKERKKRKERKEILTVNTACFLEKKGRSSTRDFIREVKFLHCVTVQKA